MDNYTETTKNWLEERYSQVDENGIYVAHQPIYGFRNGKSDPSLLGRYIITYQIIKALSKLKFDSLLDVGGAEGYKAALIKEIFNVRVCSTDLSAQACQRAKEIFGINAVQGDVHKLDFSDKEFDIVLCSETLEHVSNMEDAVYELLRVAKNAVIITVPHESPETISRNIQRKIPHAHIHFFDENSFNFVVNSDVNVKFNKYYHKYLKIISLLIDGIPRKNMKNLPDWVIKLYNTLMMFSKFLAGKKTFRGIMKLDNLITNKNTKYYNGLCFVILKKDTTFYEKEVVNKIPEKILDFQVPYFYLSR